MKRWPPVVLAVLALVAVTAVAALRALSQNAPSGLQYADLQQGWTPTQSHDFWYVSQGTRLMPSAWLRALRLPDGTRIMSAANLQYLGFEDVHAKPSTDNPHGWPIGIATDRINGIEVAGFTCAACHTGEFTYKGKTMLVEGGSTNADIGRLSRQLYDAVLALKRDPKARLQFRKDAVAYGYPSARLASDFGRDAAMAQTWLLETSGTGGTSTIPGPGRIDALTGIANRLFAYDLREPHNAIRGTAPTSFPPLWDIWRLDWVQYNASARVPMGRNVGESLGVGVVTNFVDKNGKPNPVPQRWESSLRVHTLYAIEERLARLKPPVWPASLLGSVDPDAAKRGRMLFDQNCSRCHGVARIAGTTPTEWAVRTIQYQKIGTDPEEVLMFAGSRFDGSKLGLSTHLSGAKGLGTLVGALTAAAYKRDGITTPALVAKYNGWGRKGDTTAPCGYKARPLVGIWATPPFLHNGAVPSVYDLLSETRPAHPILGNAEYDPVKLGTVQQRTPVTLTLDTSKLGNSNKGHWFTNDKSRPGRIGPALTEAQKYDIIAYLKIATYGNYPTTTVAAEFPRPCDNNFDWANGKVPNLRIDAP